MRSTAVLFEVVEFYAIVSSKIKNFFSIELKIKASIYKTNNSVR